MTCTCRKVAVGWLRRPLEVAREEATRRGKLASSLSLRFLPISADSLLVKVNGLTASTLSPTPCTPTTAIVLALTRWWSFGGFPSEDFMQRMSRKRQRCIWWQVTRESTPEWQKGGRREGAGAVSSSMIQIWITIITIIPIIFIGLNRRPWPSQIVTFIQVLPEISCAKLTGTNQA